MIFRFPQNSSACERSSFAKINLSGWNGRRERKKETSIVSLICGSWGFRSFPPHFAFIFLEAEFFIQWRGKGNRKARGMATIPRSKREAGRLCLLNSLFGNAD